MTKPALLTALSTFSLLAASGAVQAADNDKLCAELRMIVADAPNGFASIQGQKTGQEASTVDQGITFDHYATSSIVDGAKSCEITAQQPGSDGRRLPNYTCEFPITGGDKGKATRKFATQVATCLPGISHPAGPGLNKDGGMLTAHSADYHVSYTFLSGPAHDTMTLMIQSGTK